MFDTHSHLFETVFENDIEECILRAKNNNVLKCMLVGFSFETNVKAYNLAKLHPEFFYNSAGIHPSEVGSDLEGDLNKLEEFINTHKVYAIGEIGLDYYWVKDNKEIQKAYFISQMNLAYKYNLPVIIHMRDATMDTYEILKEYKGKVRGIMHCYSGSYEMALRFIDLGFYISIGGPVTFKNAKEPKEVAKNIPLDKLLIETDCPYLAPTPYRGQRNETSYVALVLREIASLRNMDEAKLDEITTSNAYNIFGLEV